MSYTIDRTDKLSNFVFHKANNIDELEILLKLRYKIYRDSRLSMFVPENEYKLDIDYWDPYANHFGLFQVNNFKSIPVGYIRVVEDKETTISPDIYSIAYQYPGMLEKILCRPEYPFPLMKYVPQLDKVQTLHNKIKSKGERLVEASRISVDQSLCSLRLARYIIDCCFSIYFLGSLAEYSIWSCSTTHKACYSRYGLKPIDDTTDFIVPGSSDYFTCLVGTSLGLPDHIRSKLQKMSIEYKRTGQIIYRPLSQTQLNISPTNEQRKVEVA